MNYLIVFSLSILFCLSQARPQDESISEYDEESGYFDQWISGFIGEMMTTIDTYLTPVFQELEDSRKQLGDKDYVLMFHRFVDISNEEIPPLMESSSDEPTIEENVPSGGYERSTPDSEAVTTPNSFDEE
ncbi:hypothetical protein evm_001677 [Chilo suppressalis]|nr:hypothetical protein evm_001677 [Chilo suppressalis]